MLNFLKQKKWKIDSHSIENGKFFFRAQPFLSLLVTQELQSLEINSILEAARKEAKKRNGISEHLRFFSKRKKKNLLLIDKSYEEEEEFILGEYKIFCVWT